MANSWSNTFQSSLTLPTGATSGARIVLDGTNDEILIYNSAGQLVDTIGGPNGAITIGPAGGAQVILQQSGGLGTIFFPTGRATERTAAQINAGAANQNLPNEFLALTITGPSVNTFADKIRFQLNSQAANGSSNANFEIIADHSNNTSTTIVLGDLNQVNFAGNVVVAGTIIAQSNIGVEGLTQPIDSSFNVIPTQVVGSAGAASYASQWAAAVSFDGVAIDSLRYRRLPDGNIHVWGCTQGVTAPGATVFTLPAAYMPTGNIPFTLTEDSGSSGTFKTGFGRVTAGGAVQINLDGVDRVNNSLYVMNFIYPGPGVI